MTDTRSKQKNQRISTDADGTYEVAAFMAKYQVTSGEAQTIIKRYGPARKKLDAYMAARNA